MTGTRRLPRLLLALAALAAVAGAALAGRPAAQRFATPIRHVVVIVPENHSFNNVLGAICVQQRAGTLHRAGLDMGCEGTSQAKLSDGSTLTLGKAKDIVAPVVHDVHGQEKAMDGGAMDRFDQIGGCGPKQGYACLTMVQPTQEPNITALAEQFAISDHTFEFKRTPSWGGHLTLVAASDAGFTGDIPLHASGKAAPGWGCDSRKSSPWGPQGTPEPSCVPDYGLDPSKYPYGGAYKKTPVPNVPTIFDEAAAAGLDWRLYAGGGPYAGGHKPDAYEWAICPTFASCLFTSEVNNFVTVDNLIPDAQAGRLPAVSFVTPRTHQSTHNGFSFAAGDNWIGSVVQAIESGPDWGSTAIFITWDDCGCFYDEVNPLQYDASWGIRLPMLIVSPYARAGYTDSTPTTFTGVLPFIEHTFGLPALNSVDAGTYDYSNAFDFGQQPLRPARMVTSDIPLASRDYLREHPARADPVDPT
jgi:phospholipase C